MAGVPRSTAALALARRTGLDLPPAEPEGAEGAPEEAGPMGSPLEPSPAASRARSTARDEIRDPDGPARVSPRTHRDSRGGGDRRKRYSKEPGKHQKAAQ